MSQVIRPEAFSVKDFCAQYSLSRSTVYKLMTQGKLRTVKVAGKRLIPRESGDALLENGVR
jgi:excisionase family DNA binding protein